MWKFAQGINQPLHDHSDDFCGALWLPDISDITDLDDAARREGYLKEEKEGVEKSGAFYDESSRAEALLMEALMDTSRETWLCSPSEACALLMTVVPLP
ncbi:hypothetical protein GBF38_001828 [Nibea albiflora]|uniref:Uncharacterized protein n=1 Tax=Nibea albiflora TaxID=240163 RepID=A0ACB7EUW4_NIBAL|nr:hypothetical protein GBF38_001828 [Nibea albiflora]